MATSALTVELAIGDAEIAERVHDLLVECGFDVLATDSDDKPGVVITDSLPALADRLADAVPVVVLTDASGVAGALRMGATAMLPPDADAKVLCAAIGAAAAGLTTLSPDLRRSAINGLGPNDIEDDQEPPELGLTARELDVLRLLVDGASNKDIARQLGITPHTAKFHVAAIAAKLGASGRTDAVAKALRMGLVMA